MCLFFGWFFIFLLDFHLVFRIFGIFYCTSFAVFFVVFAFCNFFSFVFIVVGLYKFLIDCCSHICLAENVFWNFVVFFLVLLFFICFSNF